MRTGRTTLRSAHRTTRAALLAGCALAVLALAGCSDASSDEPESMEAGGKVTVAGDSISVGIGTQLRTAVDGTRVVKVIGEPGTGLARPDSFDWPARLEELARDYPPQVLVLSLGSNDAQDLLDADGGLVAPLSDDAAWDAEYTARLARSFDAFEGSGTSAPRRTASDFATATCTSSPSRSLPTATGWWSATSPTSSGRARTWRPTACRTTGCT
jgi:hypothetical protein